MNLVRIAAIGTALFGASVASASTIGLPALESGLTWDTFADANPAYPALVVNSTAPAVTGTPGITGSLTAHMNGGVTGGGDRIYNGIAAASGAYFVTINGTNTQSNPTPAINSLYLFLKLTSPDAGTGLTHSTFFTAELNGIPSTAVTLLSDNVEIVSGQQMGVVMYEWTGINILNGHNFAINLTSPASGHVSLDALRLSQVPEPGMIGLGVAAAGLFGLRRRRMA